MTLERECLGRRHEKPVVGKKGWYLRQGLRGAGAE